MTSVAVIGGGAFGTAMASVAARAGAPVLLWAREPEVVAEINGSHRNSPFLPGIDVDPAIRAVPTIEEACSGADLVILVPPAQYLRGIAAEVAAAAPPGAPAVICAKGIEQGTGALLSEAAADALPGHSIAVISGPTFADEVARGLPGAVTLACQDPATAAFVAKTISSRVFKAYTTDDVVGAQIGGAVKNVLAIAAGICAGLGMGESSRAALITRGLAEMARFGLRKGARAETLMGLSGMGDLLLTCVSTKSRNTSLGVELASGRPLADIMAERRSIAEGVFTASALVDVSVQLGIEMPITTSVHGVLTGRLTPQQALEDLLSRPLKPEWY